MKKKMSVPEKMDSQLQEAKIKQFRSDLAKLIENNDDIKSFIPMELKDAEKEIYNDLMDIKGLWSALNDDLQDLEKDLDKKIDVNDDLAMPDKKLFDDKDINLR